ncbi:MAG: shikimate kinase [Candidatus Latescibacterota bacterium]
MDGGFKPDGKAFSLIRPNIVLTGMPGAGKSTVGVVLAKEFGYSFVDTDLLIQQGEGKLLQEIIDTRGLEYFLALEERYIIGLTVRGAVIAPGGSVVLSAGCMESLRRHGIIVFLDVPIEMIRMRIDEYSRGIVMKPGSSLYDVWKLREPLYRATADLTVDCRHLSQTETSNLIARELRQNWCHLTPPVVQEGMEGKGDSGQVV